MSDARKESPPRPSVLYQKMSENPIQISEYLDYLFAYGTFWVYLIIFAACFIENIFPPFPGDSFIVAAGGLVALGRLDLVVTFFTVVAGGVASVMVLYMLGKRYGREYFIRKDFKYFSAEDIVRMERQFARYGTLIIIFSRFVVGLRAALAIVAGIGRYQAARMLVFTVISYFLFAGLLIYIAIKLVENLDTVTYYFKTYNTIVWPVVIALVGWLVIYKIVTTRKRK